MGIFTDFYVADSAELGAVFGWIGSGPEGDVPDPAASADALNEWLEDQPAREPSEIERTRMKALDRLEYKGVMSSCVSVLRHLLLGTEIKASGDSIFWSMGESLEQVPDDLVDAMARCSDDEVLQLAPAWAAHEEVRWSEHHAVEFLPDFARLARKARIANKSIYLLVSGV